MTLLAPERMRGQMMGLWFCASALGNLAAGLICGHVKADQLSLLPDLFARCAIALLITTMSATLAALFICSCVVLIKNIRNRGFTQPDPMPG